jgi:hypothetical protein
MAKEPNASVIILAKAYARSRPGASNDWDMTAAIYWSSGPDESV